MSPSPVTALVFDVLGTLLDEDTALADAAATAAAAAKQPGIDPTRVEQDWSSRVSTSMDAIVEDRASFETIDVLRRRALSETATRFELALTPVELDLLARAGHRLAPFPDTVAACEALARHRPLVALTNAGWSQAFAMSAHAGLRWTTVISAEAVQTYKPNPRMYAYAIERLELDPTRTLFVAAHPWDLDAAATHGFLTAYVDRADSSLPDLDAYSDRFDIVVPDLTALAELLS